MRTPAIMVRSLEKCATGWLRGYMPTCTERWDSMRCKRGRFKIIEDILDLCIIKTRRTGIVYKCNLNFEIVQRY